MNADDQTFRQSDVLDPARARALQATLGHAPTLTAGNALPGFYHQIYFWDPQPPDALSTDGHPATGSALIPDLGLPQRMWAGGALTFHQPLRLGQSAEKTSRCAKVAEKPGKSGRLGFVTLEHCFTQDEVLCLTETQTLVYREEQPMTARRVPSVARVPVAERSLTTDATLLFRYSALTFNGHRIHYDLDFARGAGGYSGLVVHGPLLAQWLMDLAEAQLGALKQFSFRAVAPLIAGETARICMDDHGLWVEGPDRRLCMTAEAHA